MAVAAVVVTLPLFQEGVHHLVVALVPLLRPVIMQGMAPLTPAAEVAAVVVAVMVVLVVPD